MFSAWHRYWTQRRLRRQAAKQMADSSARRSPWLTPVRWVLGFPAAVWRSWSLAMQSWVERLSGQRRLWRDLLLGIPSILLFIGFVTATAVGSVNQQGSGLLYWRAGEQALAGGNNEAAVIFLQKAMTTKNASNRDIMFGLARAYEATEQFQRADVLMSTLAGVGVQGLPQAHRYLAIRTAEKVAQQQRVDDLESWHWHLSHADQAKSAPLQKSWGMYYLVGGDIENAITHYRIAAEEEPAIWLQVADLEARRNDIEAVRRTLATARERLEQQFIRDPGNAQNRLQYAASLFYIGELPDAERLLKEGLAEGDNEKYRQLLAAVFTRMYDVEESKDTGIASAFRFLRMALEYDPNFNPALLRIVKFARSSPESLEESREAMRQMITTGNTSAMAHFTLGTLEWIAGNRELALLNMRQAMQLDAKMPIIANNLAFLMAQEEKPDLQSALSLVNQAIESSPENSDFRDTRGDIYLKLGETAKAAVDFQVALETAKNPRPLQEKLASLYETLGDPVMAKKFRDASRSSGR